MWHKRQAPVTSHQITMFPVFWSAARPLSRSPSIFFPCKVPFSTSRLSRGQLARLGQGSRERTKEGDATTSRTPQEFDSGHATKFPLFQTRNKTMRALRHNGK